MFVAARSSFNRLASMARFSSSMAALMAWKRWASRVHFVARGLFDAALLLQGCRSDASDN
jgi:hypothetical protein